MAALLKKRALAEYSQVIQEEPKPVLKKLRLVHKAKSPEPTLNLQSAATSYDAFQALLHFQESLPVASDHVEPTLRLLLDHYKNEKEAFVRAKIAALIGELAKAPDFNAALLIDEIHGLINSEKSHKALSQLLASLICIGRSQPQDSKLHLHLMDIARQNLTDGSHLVRCKALELIGALGSPDQRKLGDSQSKVQKRLQTILGEHAHDVDPRVRSSAFEAMLSWHQRGIKLDVSLYAEVCDALSDDYEGVRLAACKLIWVLSQLYPENIVPSADSQEDIRLVDDGFARICHMVNDLTVRVRAEAVGLLGSLHLVSHRFLEQTLDKKLMSNMRRKKTAHERQKEHFQRGEWATGQKWADDAPKEEVDADAASIISSGACGAFVHGLEDEFLEVRNAAIDSLCELATQSSGFAILSQDFLVDMFNDEIEAVRLNAINSLQKIAHHITLREDQLDIILGVLKDFSFEMREALRNMLCVTKMGTKACLHTCVMEMLDALRRYPEDRASVWRCMKHLGNNQTSLVLPLVSELLSNHPYFDTPEPDMDDPAYISVLLMVFNAAAKCPTMPTLFPDHTFKHYMYLRDSLPDMVPDLQLSGIVSPVRSGTCGRKENETFLTQTLERLAKMEKMDAVGAQQLMEIIIKDLGRVKEVSPSSAATAECLSMYLQCQVCLSELKSGQQWSSASIVSTQQRALSMSLIDKVLLLTEHMENLFVGLSTTDLAMIRQVRLRAHTFQLLSKLHTGMAENRSACIHYLQALSQLQRLLTSQDLSGDDFTQALLSDMHRLESCEPATYRTVLQSVLPKHRPAVLKLSNRVQQARVTLTETMAADNTIKFTAGLTAAVPVDAMLDNVENIQSIRIQLKYPDQQTQVVIPRTAHFRQLGPLQHRLVTEVLLSHNTWSDPSHVEVSVVMCYNPDRDIQSDKPENNRLDHAACSSLLPLCQPFKVLVNPKPSKR